MLAECDWFVDRAKIPQSDTKITAVKAIKQINETLYHLEI